MWETQINYLAVLAAAAAAMVIGFIWYAKSVFGTAWMAEIGKSEADIKAGYKPTMFLWSFILALVEAWVLAVFTGLLDNSTLPHGLQTAFWLWLGFTAVPFGVDAIYNGKSRKLYWITAGYHLVTLLVMGVILAVWR